MITSCLCHSGTLHAIFLMDHGEVLAAHFIELIGLCSFPLSVYKDILFYKALLNTDLFSLALLGLSQ